MKYGKITNIATGYNGTDRMGDYGSDKDGFMFVYTINGWKPTNNDSYQANYYKKKYLALKKKISNH
jgi:hypothetical protein